MDNKNKRKENKHAIQTQLANAKVVLKNGTFVFNGPMTVGDFALAIQKTPATIVGYLFKKGLMLNINSTIDEEQIAELCLEFGFDFQKQQAIDVHNVMEHVQIDDDETELIARAPIITIMGHVDHGKTTLVDKIRNTNIAKHESGGITQHTGAYSVKFKDKFITFLDTPGHEAFSAMRARGAQLTDLVILVVAADDGVMMQTKEAIDHAHAAKVPLIVFVNKMDKPGANLEKIKGDLSRENVVAEEWGGSTPFVYGSALMGDGIDNLLEAIILQAEILELKANPNRLPIGTIVEARLDKGKGVIATIIVEHGTLYARDFLVAGAHYGRIKTLQDTSYKAITQVKPGHPAIITGLNYSPFAGDKFFGFRDEKFAKKLANEKAFANKQSEFKDRSNVGQTRETSKVVNLIIKTDVQGTSEAIRGSLSKVGNDEVSVNVIRSSVGALSKSDVSLAQTSNAIIVTFNIKPTPDIKKMADELGVKILHFSVIYEIIATVENMVKGLKTPKFEEKYVGEAQVLKTFFYSKVGTIAGSIVLQGQVKADCLVKVFRQDKLVFEGKLDSLQRGIDSVKLVDKGKEMGCHIKNFDDIMEQDLIKFYELVEVE